MTVNSVADFKRRAKACFLRGNPDATGLDWVWSTEPYRKPRKVTYPTGYVGYTGYAYAAAPGFKPQVILCQAGDDGVMVRPVGEYKGDLFRALLTA